MLTAKGARVAYHDPHVPALTVTGARLESVATVRPADYDLLLVLTNHDGYDWPALAREAALIIDTRNATGGLGAAANVIRL
jgi:UDP-N-acetyl-D-glucosamine dehydrogenase